MRFLRWIPVAVGATASMALGQVAPPAPGEQVIIITAPASQSERDEVQSVDAAAIRGSGRPDLLGALSRSIPGLSLQDAQGNAFEPNLVYRGFTASALQGQPQGLAVYLDGARFNEPFGETVHFDLIPSIAIKRADLFDASAVYGLNALGGALAIETKTGRSAPGLFASVSTARFGDNEAVAEGGWSSGRASAYFAVQMDKDSGWRLHSPSSLVSGLADVGWDGADAGVHFTADFADADLTGNGSAPVQLLSANYRAVFTRPDTTRDDYVQLSLHPWLEFGRHDRLQGTLYAQRYSQKALNGDMADIAACDNGTGPLCLQSGHSEEPLRDAQGAAVPARGATLYGLLNGSHTRTDAAGVLTQIVDRRPLGALVNVLTLGFSYDASHTNFDSSSELGALTQSRQVVGLGAIVAQPDGAVTPVSLGAGTAYTGVFAAEELPLARNLTANLDVRWNQALITMSDKLGQALTGRHVYRRFNPGAQLNWRGSPQIELRAGISQSNRSPAPAELACASANDPCSLTDFFIADPPLKQVVTTTSELGGQGKLGSFTWLATAYRSTNANDIQFVASDTRGRAFFRNVGKTRRQGIEATLSWHRGPLALRVGYALTDATFRTSLLVNSPDNPDADQNGQIMVRPGDGLPGVPRERAILSADYDGRTWSLGGDVQATRGAPFFGDEGNLDRPTNGYIIGDVRASIGLIGAVRLFGEIRNLLDTHYATYGDYSETDAVPLTEAPGAANPRSLTPGAPRTWLIGMKSDF